MGALVAGGGGGVWSNLILKHVSVAKERPYPLFNLRNGHVACHSCFYPPCCVKFKKWPCRRVEFSGSDPLSVHFLV